jgi:hypothetical protein
MEENNFLYIDINNCARCEENHTHVLFKRFKNSLIVENHIFNYWGICPVTSEPILLKIIEIK